LKEAIMSRSRAWAALAAFVAMLAATLGVATLSPTAASAAPKVHYPPPPPSLVVNRGVVKYGVTVTATGRQFAGKEKVYLTVSYRAKGSNRWRTVKTSGVRTDRKGKFVIGVKMSQPGQVIINAKGTQSHKGATAFVYVIDKKKGSGPWSIKRTAFSTGTTGTGTAVLTSSTRTPSDNAGLAIAGLGVMALAGSAVVARTTIRRRRKAAAAA
jgi:hypothetical protein